MFNNNTTPFTMPVMPANSNGGFGGFGGDGWWIILLFIFIASFGGWGNNGGWGGNQGSTSVYEGYVLNNDMSMLQRSISDSTNMLERRTDNIINGLCDGFYTTAQQINGLGTNILTSTNAIQSQLADCCCKTQTAIGDVKYAIGSTGADINYNIATQANMLDRTVSDKFCQTNFNMQTNTRDVIDSQRADTQAILAKLDAMETNRLREKLEAERDAKYALQGQLDRAQLRTDIVNDVRPCPIPAYITCNPFGCNCQQNVYGTTIA